MHYITDLHLAVSYCAYADVLNVQLEHLRSRASETQREERLNIKQHFITVS